MNGYYVRELSLEEIKNASELIWKSFYYSHKEIFTMDGMEYFRDMTSFSVLQYEVLYGEALVKGCFLDGELLGVSVSKTNHLVLLFVEKSHQRQGIGGALLNEFILRNKGRSITVRSTPRAVGFYSSFGFQCTGAEMNEEGLRYVPMIKRNL